MSTAVSEQPHTTEDRLRAELAQLVGVSSQTGDRDGAERMVALCESFMPPGMVHRRVPCATDGCSADLISKISGTGRRRIVLLGHLDTVVPSTRHQPLREDGDRLYGSGTIDMKAGVAIALAVTRALAELPDTFAELAVLLVCDEEVRSAPFAHLGEFGHYDACLCFEGGELDDDGSDGVVVTRKGAGTLRVYAHGLAAHSGAAPWMGRNALLALAQAAVAVEAHNDPHGAAQLTVVPTVMRAGDAFNVVPDHGELTVDMRAGDISVFESVLASIPPEVNGVTLEGVLERAWPAMDSSMVAAPVLKAAEAMLGRPVRPRARGGCSDASHFAAAVPLTIDGLGPLGAGAHATDEHVVASSLGSRTELALAVARAALAHG